MILTKKKTISASTIKDQKRQTFKSSKGAKQTQYDIYMEDKAIIKQ